MLTIAFVMDVVESNMQTLGFMCINCTFQCLIILKYSLLPLLNIIGTSAHNIHFNDDFEFILDGIPLICGGYICGSSSCIYSDKCYRYMTDEDTWVQTAGTMKDYKYRVAADYTDTFGFALAHYGDPLEVTFDGDTFSQLATYPNEEIAYYEDSGCLVVVDANTLFLAGGFKDDVIPGELSPGSRNAYLYDREYDTWREVPSMNMGRYRHSCGIIDSYGGSGKDIIVAGGYPYRQSVEIFSLDTETWRKGILVHVATSEFLTKLVSSPGNDLPYDLERAYSVRWEDSFVLVGGYGNGNYLDTLLKYEPMSDTWLELPGKLNIARRELIAIVVDQTIFPECP